MPESVPDKLWPADPVERAAAAAAAGLVRPVAAGTPDALCRLVDADAEPRVRAAALGALARLPDPRPDGGAGAAADPDPRIDAWVRAAADSDPSVRRRAADLAPAFARSPGGAGEIAGGLLAVLDDGEAAVAESAAWALGELGPAAVTAGAVGPLAAAAGSHPDPLVREAAVAALGSLGDAGGLEAVLAACKDRPAIRRRAVLALAAFEGPAVDEALRAALEDKDWQTRQAAEDLLG